MIVDEWILYVVEHPERESLQQDGRIRRWAKIDAMEGRYLQASLRSRERFWGLGCPKIFHEIEDSLDFTVEGIAA